MVDAVWLYLRLIHKPQKVIGEEEQADDARRIATSGHRGLPEPTEHLVDAAIRAALADRAPDLTGISCPANGADQTSPEPYPIRR